MSAARPFGDDPSARARSGHKRATSARLDEAFRAGLLTTPDHDLRVAQAESALTVGELEALLRDLEPQRATTPAPTSVVAPLDAAAPPPYGASVLSADTLMPTPQGPPLGPDGAGPPGLTSSGSRTAFGFILVAALLVVGLGVAVFAMTTTERQFTQEATGTPREAPAGFVLGERSVDRFLRELDRSAGGLQVVSALFFADHVVVEVPGEDGGAQLVSYQRPGQLVELGEEAPRSSPATVDLARLDVTALVRNFRRAPARVHLRGRVDVIATVSRQTRQGPATVVFAVTNAGGRYGYVITDLAGRVTSVGRADG